MPVNKVKPKQQELKNMPAKDACGKLADKLADARQAITDGHSDSMELEQQLGEALDSTGRDKIKVGDAMFYARRTSSKWKISIKRDKK